MVFFAGQELLEGRHHPGGGSTTGGGAIPVPGCGSGSGVGAGSGRAARPGSTDMLAGGRYARLRCTDANGRDTAGMRTGGLSCGVSARRTGGGGSSTCGGSAGSQTGESGTVGGSTSTSRITVSSAAGGRSGGSGEGSAGVAGSLRAGGDGSDGGVVPPGGGSAGASTGLPTPNRRNGRAGRSTSDGGPAVGRRREQRFPGRHHRRHRHSGRRSRRLGLCGCGPAGGHRRVRVRIGWRHAEPVRDAQVGRRRSHGRRGRHLRVLRLAQWLGVSHHTIGERGRGWHRGRRLVVKRRAHRLGVSPHDVGDVVERSPGQPARCEAARSSARRAASQGRGGCPGRARAARRAARRRRAAAARSAPTSALAAAARPAARRAAAAPQEAALARGQHDGGRDVRRRFRGRHHVCSRRWFLVDAADQALHGVAPR